MKKPILLLQFRPSPTAEHEVECIIKSMKIGAQDVVVRNVILDDTALPNENDLENFSAFVFGASSDYNVTNWQKDIQEKCLSTKFIYDYALKNNIPTLGICFGHQLIAHFAGGVVSRDNSQAEGGVVELQLNEVAKNEKIFENFPSNFYVASGHKDSVTKLPAQAVKLGSTKATENSIFKINNIICIQQHPELDVEGLVWRLSLFPEYKRGRSMEEIKKEFQPMPYATKFMENFKKMID